jgi:hypothetical protein
MDSEEKPTPLSAWVVIAWIVLVWSCVALLAGAGAVVSGGSEYPVLALAILCDLFGPAAFLLLMRRWTGRWWVAILAIVVVAPFVAFFFTGGLAYGTTYWEVVVRGNTTIPDREGRSVAEYLAFNFAVGGAYGVMFAGAGFLLSLPPLICWRVVHRRSFHRVIGYHKHLPIG